MSPMKATALEFRLRLLIHTVIYVLGFRGAMGPMAASGFSSHVAVPGGVDGIAAAG